jgi:hypothetical protein
MQLPRGEFFFSAAVGFPGGSTPRRGSSRLAEGDLETMAEPIVLAFSGGLDTSFCVPWLKEKHGRAVITVIDRHGRARRRRARLAAKSTHGRPRPPTRAEGFRRDDPPPDRRQRRGAYPPASAPALRRRCRDPHKLGASDRTRLPRLARPGPLKSALHSRPSSRSTGAVPRRRFLRRRGRLPESRDRVSAEAPPPVNRGLWGVRSAARRRPTRSAIPRVGVERRRGRLEAAPPEPHHAFERTGRVTASVSDPDAVIEKRSAPRRSASAAASTSATRSSATRGASPSRRRRPTC